jgi:two-component system chemotaxis response regulator CheY
MRVLVVDDSSTMRAVLRMTLQQHGFEVLQAKHGLEALSVLAEVDPVDLVLIDWNMPVMNGFELLLRIRQEPKYNGTQIIMVTTETCASEMSRALAAGANDYIMKPFALEAVVEKLRLIGLCA